MAGGYPIEEQVSEMRKLLEIPETIVPFSLVSIGYPAEQAKPADRFVPSRIHYDKW
jgi:hypothetical protein